MAKRRIALHRLTALPTFFQISHGLKLKTECRPRNTLSTRKMNHSVTDLTHLTHLTFLTHLTRSTHLTFSCSSGISWLLYWFSGLIQTTRSKREKSKRSQKKRAHLPKQAKRWRSSASTSRSSGTVCAISARSKAPNRRRIRSTDIFTAPSVMFNLTAISA